MKIFFHEFKEKIGFLFYLTVGLDQSLVLHLKNMKWKIKLKMQLSHSRPEPQIGFTKLNTGLATKDETVKTTKKSWNVTVLRLIYVLCLRYSNLMA